MKCRQIREMSTTIWSFSDEYWVVCPRCSKRALVRPSPGAARLICVSCGALRSWRPLARRAGIWQGGTDPYFNLPLWLKIPCGNELLWACNERHLNFLDEYVRAENRRRTPLVPGGPRNALLESRLPRWMKLARNREAVLAAITKMRASIA